MLTMKAGETGARGSVCAWIFHTRGGSLRGRLPRVFTRNSSMTARLARSRQWRSVFVWLAIVAILLPAPLRAEKVILKNGTILEGGYGVIASLKTDLLRNAPPPTAANRLIGLVDDDLRRVFFGQ